MYIELFKTIFIIISIIFVLLLSLRNYISYKIKDNQKISAFISLIAGFLLLYVIFAIILSVLLPDIFKKLLMIFFGFSPFLIGYFATYEKVRFFGFLQIILAVISIICVYLF